MPTILKIYGVRFYFYSNEEDRMHVHVQVQSAKAKIWLDTFEVAENKGFKKHEIAKIVKLVRKYENEIKESWNEHFSRD
jgi:hypothetical protein